MLQETAILYERPLNSFPLVEQLDQHFLSLNKFFELKKPEEKDQRRILTIIERNDKIAGLLDRKECKDILTQENDLKGSCKVGVILCIDGRIPIIHQFGRALNAWEVAGSLIGLKNNGKKIDSLLFNEILKGFIRSMGDENRDLLEIVTAHTSLSTDHKCGAIQEGIDKGTYDKNRPPVDIALEEADKRTIAIENTYNQLLENKKKGPLSQVAITALIDTDTMGFILNYGKLNELSTTKLLNNGLDKAIENIMGEIEGSFGSMRDTFTNTDYFPDYSKRILQITESLLTINNLKFSGNTNYQDYISNYIDQNYNKKFTPDQKKALQFTIARTIAVQYLTGLSKLPESGHPDHPFSEHGENYMVIAPNGKGVGRFDIKEQAFISSPSGTENGIKEIHKKLLLLDKNRKKKSGHDILFVSNPIDKKIWIEKNQMVNEIRKDSAELYVELMKDKEIGSRIRNGNLIIIPVLVDQEMGEVLEILDHSIHL